MSVGEQLTAARQRAGLSIQDVSNATRIRPGLLTAMEADDFSRCGGPFYARGHLRTIARVVDTDPKPLLAAFDAAHGAEPVSSRRAELAEPKPPTVHPARPRWAVVMGAILVGLLGWGMVRLFTLPSDVEATASSTPSTPVTTTVPVRAPATPQPSVRPATTRPAPPAGTVRVTLEAIGDGSWVTLRNVRGRQLFTGRLRAGSSQSMTYGGGIRVLIDAPKNVRVFVNGARVVPGTGRFTVTLKGAVQTSER